jgi:hypothetical protein
MRKFTWVIRFGLNYTATNCLKKIQLNFYIVTQKKIQNIVVLIIIDVLIDLNQLTGTKVNAILGSVNHVYR